MLALSPVLLTSVSVTMKIIEGNNLGSKVTFLSSESLLQIHARLMVVKAYTLPQDMHAISLLEKRYYHSFEQWLIMILAGLTIIGLLLAIPLYKWGKKLEFKLRFEPKHDAPFIVQGDKNDWQLLQGFLH